MDYNKIPKVELHLHLDGSIRIETLAKLANISIEEAKSKSCAPSKCFDLNDYLTRFELPIRVMQTKENIKLIAKELAEDLKKDSIVYAEIRFAPNKHLNGGLTLDDVVLAAIDGLNQIDLKTKLILCLMRNDSFEDNKKIIDLAYKYIDKIGGIDLAGAESLYPTNSFKELFDYAKSLKIPFTIHAGESGGIESLNSAIDFGTKRIGHGIECIKDPKLIQKIKDNNILLEICPTSNVQTNVVDNLSEHPFYYLYKNGVRVSLNTDNRTVSSVTLSQEYQNIGERFNLTLNDFKQINLYALENSFINDDEKQDIYKYFL